MSRRRLRRRSEKAQRHAPPLHRAPATFARGRSRGDPRRAARLHAHAGGGGARHQPLDLQPTRLALRRDGRDAVGCTTDPGRRAEAADRRTAPASSSASASPVPTLGARPRWCHASSSASGPSTPPAGAWLKSHATSTPTDADGTRRRTVVAVDRARCSSPSRSTRVCANLKRQNNRRLTSSPGIPPGRATGRDDSCSPTA